MSGMRRHQRLITGGNDFIEEQQYLTKESCLPPENPPGLTVFLTKRCSAVRLLIVFCLFMLIFSPFVFYYWLTGTERNSLNVWQHEFGSDQDSHNDISFSFVDEFGVPVRVESADLHSRVDDLNRIRSSVLHELRSLEWKRRSLKEEIVEQTEKYEKLQTDVSHKEKELTNIHNAIEQAELARKEAAERNRPEIALPQKLLPPLSNLDRTLLVDDNVLCNMERCFDYIHCSVTAPFSAYIYPADELGITSPTASSVYSHLASNVYATNDPAQACIFIVLWLPESKMTLNSLKFWRGDGRNHVILELNSNSSLTHVRNSFGRAIIVSNSFETFRSGFDLIIPPLFDLPLSNDDTWSQLPSLLPSRRQYLLTYWGHYRSISGSENSQGEQLLTYLKEIQKTKTNDKFYFSFQCHNDVESDVNFFPCGDQRQRADLLKQSTFVLIIPEYIAKSKKQNIISNFTVIRVVEALKFGAVPVLLGDNLISFDEVLDWNLCSIHLPLARVSELHFLLRAIAESDLLEMRRRGRLFYENYFSSSEAVINTIISVLRVRIGVPASPAPEMQGKPVLSNLSWSPSRTTEMPISIDPEEYLGAVELPYPSVKFVQNFTLMSQHNYLVWNKWFTADWLYPQLLDQLKMPTEAQFHPTTDYGFRPINFGQGGSGKEFSESLGGNIPREQFTIIILSYEREGVLVSSLQRLNRLPYLNKVIVIWNGPSPPSPDTMWPKLHVPIVFVSVGKNSLNNRFLPLSQIDTEAILSLDDDVHLTQAEMIFAFRVWREERDRIVGFPGRFHAWNGDQRSWMYNSNHSCQLSMVLTGAAFFHKYYSYLYTYKMPKAIREKVDQLMNCEDLAMNFLVSHITRKPPVKVTSKWTFRCPGCPETLSADESHFLERHSCMDYFTHIYGYNPLLNTQFRVDSVLFKTRIPHQHQKCFKFI